MLGINFFSFYLTPLSRTHCRPLTAALVRRVGDESPLERRIATPTFDVFFSPSTPSSPPLPLLHLKRNQLMPTSRMIRGIMMNVVALAAVGILLPIILIPFYTLAAPIIAQEFTRSPTASTPDAPTGTMTGKEIFDLFFALGRSFMPFPMFDIFSSLLHNQRSSFSSLASSRASADVFPSPHPMR